MFHCVSTGFDISKSIRREQFLYIPCAVNIISNYKRLFTTLVS